MRYLWLTFVGISVAGVLAGVVVPLLVLYAPHTPAWSRVELLIVWTLLLSSVAAVILVSERNR